MNIRILLGPASLALLLVSLPAVAQNVRYESQGAAYVNAENQRIAERVVDRVLGAGTGAGSQVVFFRPRDRIPGDASLHEGDVALAELPGGAYYATAVAPGTHTFAVDGNPLSVQVAPGERQYIKVDRRQASPRLSPTNALTFLRLATGDRQTRAFVRLELTEPLRQAPPFSAGGAADRHGSIR